MFVDVQLNPAKVAWPGLRERALAAEAAGFGAVWVFDHLDGGLIGGTTTLEPFTLLGALAASTTTITLGTLVLNVFHRQPAVVAVGAASLAAIGERQVLIGLGAGATPGSRWASELHAVGQEIEPSLPRRHARVEQVIDLCRRMWADDRPAELATFPLPHPRPELHVGAGGRALAAVAGRCADGVNIPWHHPRRDELVTAARDARTVSRGTLDGFAVTVWSFWDHPGLLDAGHPERRLMDELGVERLILIPTAELTPDELAACRPQR